MAYIITRNFFAAFLAQHCPLQNTVQVIKGNAYWLFLSLSSHNHFLGSKQLSLFLLQSINYSPFPCMGFCPLLSPFLLSRLNICTQSARPGSLVSCGSPILPRPPPLRELQ